MTHIEKLKSITHCPICKRELQRLDNGRTNYCYTNPQRIECELIFYNDKSIYFYIDLNGDEKILFTSHDEYGKYINHNFENDSIPFHIDWVLSGNFFNKIKAIKLLQ